MFRMSDIYDKFKSEGKGKKLAKPERPADDNEYLPPEKPASKSDIKPKAQAFSEDVPEAKLHAVSEKAQKVYKELCDTVRRLYDPKTALTASLAGDIKEIVEKVVEALQSDPKSLMKLALDEYPNIEEYFFYHIANVTVLSLELAMGLGYDKKGEIEIGTGAVLHDIGIMKFEKVIGTSKALTKIEYDAVKGHPQAGLEAVEKLGKSVSPVVKSIVYQEHERIDGSGYPEGSKGAEITEQAQVVGLIDVYEALTHQRPYMNKHKIEAIKSILNMKSAFDPKLVKVLIERVGIFPVGVFVRLNTKETGIVVDNNTKLPFRPIVKIMYDTEGRKLKEPKLVNLADNSVLFIHECTETPPQGTR